MNKEWILKFEYVFKLINVLLLDDQKSLNDILSHPTFKEYFDYDIEKVGLYKELRNKNLVFIVNGGVINRNETLENNGIKPGSAIVINIMD